MLHTETLLGFHDSSRFETTGETERKKGCALWFMRTATVGEGGRHITGALEGSLMS
jgi:hypothetical protein